MEERELFFQDAQRLADTFVQSATYRSLSPIFNFSAVHVPSADSGISTASSHKDTPYGLFRKNPRLIYLGSGRHADAWAACKLAGRCDFFVVIANDNCYGGLAAGYYVIITRSETSGWITLRHELGHIFADVGEEYDGGEFRYGGPNSASGLQKVPWAHWLTEPNLPLARQRAVSRLCLRPFLDLTSDGTAFELKSDGAYAKWALEVSVCGDDPGVGVAPPAVHLDGEELGIKAVDFDGFRPPAGLSPDRQYFSFRNEAGGLSEGKHRLVVSLAAPSEAPGGKLAFVQLLEFGTEAEFRMDPDYIGAFPTWNIRGKETYRPTRDRCLMRNMHAGVLCPVCKEGVWHKMLARVSLIDGVDVTRANGHVKVALQPVALAQFRATPDPGSVESFEVSWVQDGVAWHKLRGEFSFELPETEAQGRWVVTLVYKTAEVRKDKKERLTSEKTFRI